MSGPIVSFFASIFLICAPVHGKTSSPKNKLKGLTLPSTNISPHLKRKKYRLPVRLPQKRGPASFAAGFRKIKTNKCPIYRHPTPISSRIGSLKKGTRIWLEGVNSEWTRGFRRRQSIFVPTGCLVPGSEI